MPADEIRRAQRLLGDLRTIADGLRSREGDSFPVRRLVNDLERIEIHLAELGADGCHPSRPVEVVLVPDTPYDPRMWQGADDEGLGGRRVSVP